MLPYNNKYTWFSLFNYKFISFVFFLFAIIKKNGRLAFGDFDPSDVVIISKCDDAVSFTISDPTSTYCLD